jgi:hypothetical protein
MLIKEIAANQADLIKSFAIFYLLLVTNYVGASMFTCFQVKYIRSHKYIQLLMAFFIFYFLVTLVSDTDTIKYIPPIEKLIYSIVYFIIFLIAMRLDIRITIFVFSLIFIIYFFEINKTFYLHNKNIKKKYWITLNEYKAIEVKNNHFKIMNQIEKLIYYLIMFLLIVGIIHYRGEIYDTLNNNKNLSIFDILFNTTNICKLKHNKDFLHYFRKGLNI